MRLDDIRVNTPFRVFIGNQIELPQQEMYFIKQKDNNGEYKIYKVSSIRFGGNNYMTTPQRKLVSQLGEDFECNDEYSLLGIADVRKQYQAGIDLPFNWSMSQVVVELERLIENDDSKIWYISKDEYIEMCMHQFLLGEMDFGMQLVPDVSYNMLENSYKDMYTQFYIYIKAVEDEFDEEDIKRRLYGIDKTGKNWKYIWDDYIKEFLE